MSEQEREPQEGDSKLYVVARTSKEGGYSGYASLPLKRDGDKVLIDKDGDCTGAYFYPDVRMPQVAWFIGSQRRDVLGLFARFPRIFERCEIVDVRTLSSVRAKNYARKLGKEVTPALATEEKRTYVVIRSPGFKMVALRAGVQIEEISLTEKEFTELASK